MRRIGPSWGRMVAVAALVAAAGACGDGGPVAPEANGTGDLAASMAGGVDVARSLKEGSSGSLEAVGPCAAGVAFVANGTGVATHIGAFEIDLTWCMDPATGVIAGGDAAVVAANGDRIAMTLTGQATSATDLLFDISIVGGTGRFGGASGSLAVAAVLGAAGSWTSEGNGWISY